MYQQLSRPISNTEGRSAVMHSNCNSKDRGISRGRTRRKGRSMSKAMKGQGQGQGQTGAGAGAAAAAAMEGLSPTAKGMLM